MDTLSLWQNPVDPNPSHKSALNQQDERRSPTWLHVDIVLELNGGGPWVCSNASVSWGLMQWEHKNHKRMHCKAIYPTVGEIFKFENTNINHLVALEEKSGALKNLQDSSFENHEGLF